MTDPASYSNEPQLNRSQHEAARQTPSSDQGAPEAESSPEQPSTFPGTDEPVQPDIIKLQPPTPTARPKRSIKQSFNIKLGSTEYSRATKEELAFCARKRRNKLIRTNVGNQWASLGLGRIVEGPALDFPDGVGPLSLETGRSHAKSNQIEQNVNRRYIVVGIIGNEESIPHETLLRVLTREDLFKQIRRAERKLRSPFRRLLSLKRIGGFGLYRCHPSHDYHSNPGISDETTRCLAELYRNFRTEKRDYQDRWMDWIHENFNNNSTNPEDGEYALQLLLRWSPLKLIIWSSFPIIFSLIIGLWYMINPHPGEDYVAVVQTAWTIASYIVTTAAVVLAVVASITQFGDI